MNQLEIYDITDVEYNIYIYIDIIPMNQLVIYNQQDPDFQQFVAGFSHSLQRLQIRRTRRPTRVTFSSSPQMWPRKARGFCGVAFGVCCWITVLVV